jgi:formylglycine-generating enzyme required for sulfatase activity
MIRRISALPLGLVLATTACSNILGIKDDSKAADCIVDDDCTQVGQVCVEYRCEDPETASGGGANVGTANAKGGRTAKGSGGSNSGGKTSAPSGGTSSVDTTAGGTSSTGGTTHSASGGITAAGGTTHSASGGTSSIGAGGLSGGTTSTGGTSSSGGTTTNTSSSGGTTSTGGASNSGGTTSLGGTTSASSTAPPCATTESQCVTRDTTTTRLVNYLACNPNGYWDAEVLCEDYCDDTLGCIKAPSCDGVSRTDLGISACNSLPLPGGTFKRTNTDTTECDPTDSTACLATVSPFRLDTFEVTVGRFRNFVNAYAHTNNLPVPSAGDGKNPNDAADVGWNTDWDAYLPENQADLIAQLQSSENGGNCLYTSTEAGNEFLPVNCADWFLAFAFCIWDGGRLPTEVEWNYAAAGGTEGRYYPWSSSSTSTEIDLTYATYTKGGVTPAPARVGSTPKGMSRWGQHDLGGNMYEWVADIWTDEYPTTSECTDCAVTAWTEPGGRVMRGGAFLSEPLALSTTFRSVAGEDSPYQHIGLRCARDF